MARRLTDNDPRREQRRQSLLLDRLEAQFRPQFKREIKRAMRDMLDTFEQTGDVMPARDHRDRVEDTFRQMAQSSATTFGKRIVDQGKAAGLILERKEEFADMMARMALSYVQAEAVRQKITRITETTREQIVAQVARGYDDGLGVADIARRISGNVDQISTWRGALIARTETHGAANFGAKEAAKGTGLQLQQEWVSAEDERTRASHRAADGNVIGMDARFNVGGASLEYPGDPAGPPDEVINCRCSVSHIVED